VVKENLLNIKERIVSACVRNGREAASVTLVCVCKNRSPGEIRQVLDASIVDIGENKVQEALLKYNQLSACAAGASASGGKRYLLNPIKWHMVGHLQTNKVKDAVKIFDLIHSVDSQRIAWEIDKQAARINKVQDILIEVNISGEESKFGVEPEQLFKLVESISQFKNVRLQGLMGMAPAVGDPQEARPYFRKLRGLKDQINGLTHLSMGMSNDFEAAIEEGATIVRIGRAIFEGLEA